MNTAVLIDFINYPFLLAILFYQFKIERRITKVETLLNCHLENAKKTMKEGKDGH